MYSRLKFLALLIVVGFILSFVVAPGLWVRALDGEAAQGEPTSPPGATAQPLFLSLILGPGKDAPDATSTATHTTMPTHTPVDTNTPTPTSTSTVTTSDPGVTPTPQETPAPGDGPQIAGCPLLPANNIWNQRVDSLPVHADSGQFIATIGTGDTLHPDFGSGEWPPGSGSPIGIPYDVVPGNQPLVAVSFDYDDESDPGPYPIPPNPSIEGGPQSDGDRHILIVDRDACVLYELFYAFPRPDGSWEAGSGARFDLRSNDLRPAGWTSADAAGLPILPGLIRYDEVAAGEIRHAIRFTAPQTRQAYVWPARHYASDLTALRFPPMGQRFRLKASFDIAGYAPQVQVILRALQRYGMILADNGSEWFLSGVPDERWDNDMLRQLKEVPGSAFEAVDVSSLMISPDSGQAQPSGP